MYVNVIAFSVHCINNLKCVRFHQIIASTTRDPVGPKGPQGRERSELDGSESDLYTTEFTSS